MLKTPTGDNLRASPAQAQEQPGSPLLQSAKDAERSRIERGDDEPRSPQRSGLGSHYGEAGECGCTRTEASIEWKNMPDSCCRASPHSQTSAVARQTTVRRIRSVKIFPVHHDTLGNRLWVYLCTMGAWFAFQTPCL